MTTTFFFLSSAPYVNGCSTESCNFLSFTPPPSPLSRSLIFTAWLSICLYRARKIAQLVQSVLYMLDEKAGFMRTAVIHQRDVSLETMIVYFFP